MLALVCAIAATGLLYLLRPMMSGFDDGIVSDALPLDELPGHAGVSILLFVIVWAAVGLWAASAAQRHRALVAFAVGLWIWELAGTTVSLAVVRQEAVLRGAFAAATVAAVYLAPLIAVTVAISTKRFHAARHQPPRGLDLPASSPR